MGSRVKRIQADAEIAPLGERNGSLGAGAGPSGRRSSGFEERGGDGLKRSVRAQKTALDLRGGDFPRHRRGQPAAGRPQSMEAFAAWVAARAARLTARRRARGSRWPEQGPHR